MTDVAGPLGVDGGRELVRKEQFIGAARQHGEGTLRVAQIGRVIGGAETLHEPERIERGQALAIFRRDCECEGRQAVESVDAGAPENGQRDDARDIG